MRKFRLDTIHLMMMGMITCGLLSISYLLLASRTLYLLLVLLTSLFVVGLLLYQKSSYALTEKEQIKQLNDTAEANLLNLLENMPVGVIQFNPDWQKITWFNPYASLLLTGEDGKFNDQLIFDFLAEKVEGASLNVLTIGDKKFTATLDREHQIFYFWDTYTPSRELGGMTDFSPVIAIISVDNYDDLADNLSDAEISEINSFIANFISEFATSRQIFYRRVEADRFYFFTDYYVLNQLIEDKFSVLDKFREEAKERELGLTLSMGISYGNHDHQDIGKVAQTNLNMAMVRGGDQIVVKANDSQKDFQYFGGGTSSTVKRSRTRTRAMMTAISDKIRMADRVFVVGHKNLDMDALGSSIGMQFFASQIREQAYAVYDQRDLSDDVARAVKRLQEEGHGYLIDLKEAFKRLTANSLLIMVDHSKVSLTLSQDFYKQFTDVIVIDHHRRDDDFPKNASLSFIESGASSASELVTELIQFQNAPQKLAGLQASVLMAGIMLDTKSFSTRVTSRTFDVASYLRRRGSDSNAIQSLAVQDFEDYRLVNRLVMSGQHLSEHIIVAMGAEDEVYTNVTTSKAADTLLTMAGIEASFVVTKNAQGKVAISARSKQGINVQRIMEAMGGGGHFNLAACQLEDYTISQATQLLLHRIAEETNTEKE